MAFFGRLCVVSVVLMSSVLIVCGAKVGLMVGRLILYNRILVLLVVPIVCLEILRVRWNGTFRCIN